MPWARAITKLVTKLVSDSANGTERTGNTLTQLQATIQSLGRNVANLTTSFSSALVGLTFSGNQITSGKVNAAYVDTIPSSQISGDWTSNVSTTGNVTASGQVTSGAPLKSIGSHNFSVTSGYVGAWINGDGQIGYSASGTDVKKDLTPMPGNNTDFLNLQPYWGRYTWDAEHEEMKVFLLAEDVRAAGFGPDVAPVDEDGKAFTINYSQLVVPLLAEVKALRERIIALEGKVV